MLATAPVCELKGESPLTVRHRLPLRQHDKNCGLIGSAEDHALFVAIYGCSVREHQPASRSGQPAQPSRVLAVALA